MKRFLIAGLLILASIAVKAQNTEKTEGSPDFPSIVLRDMDGKEVDLKSLTQEGKNTIISFWATWCSPCKKEIENMQDLIEEWKTKYNVQLVAVSIDDSRNAMKVKPYVDGKKWTCKVLLDVNSDTRRTLNYPNVPYTILISKEGKIMYKHIGYQEGDEFVLEEQLKKMSVKN